MSGIGIEERGGARLDGKALTMIMAGRALPLPHYLSDPTVIHAFLHQMSRKTDTEILQFLGAFLDAGHGVAVDNIIENRQTLEKELNTFIRGGAMATVGVSAAAVGMVLSADQGGIPFLKYVGGLLLLAMLLFSGAVASNKKMGDANLKQIERLQRLLHAARHRPAQ